MKKRHLLIALALVPLILVAAGCKKEEAAPPAAQQQPPISPPQTDIPKGPPTVIPAGETPEKYVNRYYSLYKAKKWKEAYALLPALQKAQMTFEQFQTMREGMPISSYKVQPGIQQGTTLQIMVNYDLGPQNGGFWSNLWTFKKEGAKWVADSSKAQMGNLQSTQ